MNGMNIPKKYSIIIIRPPGYVWSSVFQELAELLLYCLEDLGFEARISENRFSENWTNIVLGAHLLPLEVIPRIPEDTIIFNTEQLGVGPPKWNYKVLSLLRKFRSWDYSPKNIIKLREAGLTAPHLFKIGYHERLNRIPDLIPKDIDILFYGGLNPARSKILDGLRQRGLRVVHLSGVFGAERDASIARAQVVLNLHQYSTKILELIRIHYLMNNSKVVLSQYDDDSVGGDEYGSGLVLARYDKIVDRAVELLESREQLQHYAEASLSAIRKIDSKDSMRAVLLNTYSSIQLPTTHDY